MKNITRLLDSLNNNYGNFFDLIKRLNEVSISSQDNALSECYHLFLIFELKSAAMKGHA